MTLHFLFKDTALGARAPAGHEAGALSGILRSALHRQGAAVTEARGTQSQKGISASSAFVAPVVALRPNNALQPTALALRARASLASLGAAERGRWASSI